MSVLEQATLLGVSAVGKFSVWDCLHSDKQLSEAGSRDRAMGTACLAALALWWPWSHLCVWLFRQELFSYWLWPGYYSSESDSLTLVPGVLEVITGRVINNCFG